jgi:phosphoenolpyruvate-protein kinase (PTS system EI component)
MSVIEVTPYAPGTARGRLCRNPEQLSPDCIAMLTQPALTAIDTTPAGIIVVDGAPLSHSMIRLLSLDIPVVIVSAGNAQRLEDDEDIVIDGCNGRLIRSPGTTLETAELPAIPVAGRSLLLQDGSRVSVRASIYGSEDAVRACNRGAESIGLVRTEFIVPADGSMPDAAFYQHELDRLCAAAGSLAITLRLPDIAADKQVPWLEPFSGMTGPLGIQGIRLYQHETVRTVIDAMLEAVNSLSTQYDLKLLLPYVSTRDEFLHWRQLIHRRLQQSLPVGIMAETPAAVLAISGWFDVADFVAIGCNDLMQCLFAADRDIAALSRYLDPYSPELLRFLHQAAQSAGTNIEQVQLCGLLPQFPGVLPLLLGMGFRAFSVSPAVIPYLAAMIDQVDLKQAQRFARRACSASDSQQVRVLLGLSNVSGRSIADE